MLSSRRVLTLLGMSCAVAAVAMPVVAAAHDGGSGGRRSAHSLSGPKRICWKVGVSLSGNSHSARHSSSIANLTEAQVQELRSACTELATAYGVERSADRAAFIANAQALAPALAQLDTRVPALAPPSQTRRNRCSAPDGPHRCSQRHGLNRRDRLHGLNRRDRPEHRVPGSTHRVQRRGAGPTGVPTGRPGPRPQRRSLRRSRNSRPPSRRRWDRTSCMGTTTTGRPRAADPPDQPDRRDRRGLDGIDGINRLNGIDGVNRGDRIDRAA